MSKHTSVAEQTTQDQEPTNTKASLTTRDDQALTSLTDSAGANMETGHKDSNDTNQALLSQGSKAVSFDTRNREYLKKLAKQNKKKSEEDAIEQQRLKDYREKLENQVRKRLGDNIDLEGMGKRNKLEKNDSKKIGKDKSVDVMSSEYEQNMEERKKKALERKKITDKHTEYLEKIALKNRQKKIEADQEDALKKSKRQGLAKRVSRMSSKKSNQPPNPPESPVTQLSTPPNCNDTVGAAGSGAAAVRELKSEDSDETRKPSKATNDLIRKRHEDNMEKIRKQREKKENERKKREEIKEKAAQRRRDKIIQEARERKKSNTKENCTETNTDKNPLLKSKKSTDEASKVNAKKSLANFMSRLEKNTEKRNEAKVNWNEMDEARWRRAQGIDEDTKVFIITGFYPSLRKALLDRGWFENKDRHSRYFDLKWTIASKHIVHSEIEDHQIVNHFSRASSIVTKIGLMKNIRNLKHFANVNIDRFFPRCYDLNDIGDKEDFKDDFRCVRAQQILKQIVLDLDLNLPPIRVRPSTVPLSSRSSITSENSVDQDNSDIETETAKISPADDDAIKDEDTKKQKTQKNKKKKKKKKKFHSGIDVSDDRDFYEPIPVCELKQIAQNCSKKLEVNPSVLRAALRVMHKACRPLDDEYIDKPVKHIELLVEPEEWMCLNPNRLGIYQSGPPSEEQAPKKSKKAVPIRTPTPQERRAAEAKIRNRKKYAWKPKDYKLRQITKEEILEILVSLDLLRTNPTHQSDLNGNPTKNVWIIKPAGKSRGRGIQCFDNYDEIMKVTDSNGNGQESQWVAQKYIEHPLIIRGRKFDIRQWVLVTDWNPLTVYFYDECYLRFCASDYSLDNLKDRFIHLANNSVAKKSKAFKESAIPENMWHSDDFIEYLGTEHGSEELWHKKIQKQMKKIVTWSTMSVQDMVQNRHRSCELYGYDFMVDENLDVWLIEVNSSPAMDYSTGTTERLVKRVLPDCVKVLADYEYTGKKRKPKNVDLGGWELLYRAKKPVEYPRSALCSDLAIDGQAIKNPYKKVIRNKLPTAKKINIGSKNTMSKAENLELQQKNRKKQNHGRSDRVGIKHCIEKAPSRSTENEPAIEKEAVSEKQKKHQDENTPLPCRGNTVPTKTVTIGRTSPGRYSSIRHITKLTTHSKDTKAFSHKTHMVPHPPVLDTRQSSSIISQQLQNISTTKGGSNDFNIRQQPLGSSNPLYKKVQSRYLNADQNKNDVSKMLMRRTMNANDQRSVVKLNGTNGRTLQLKKPLAAKIFDPFAMIPQQSQGMRRGITKKRGAITGGSITGKRGDLSLSSLLPQNVRNQSNLFDSISKPHGSLNWRGVASASKQVRYHNAYNRKSLW